MKSLISLWSCTADELAVRCHTSAYRDKRTVAVRTKHEGLSFLAITLASFGKAFEGWLDQGFVVPSDAPSFAKESGRRTGLPRFLSGFLGRVFDPVCGTLCDDPCIEAIYSIRQLTLMFGKIALPDDSPKGVILRGSNLRVVSHERERLAMQEYVTCEQDVKAADGRLDPSTREDFKRMSAMLFGELFSKLDRDVYWGRLVPKHGPGAVAERTSYNAKYNQRTWPARLQEVIPAESFLVANQREESQRWLSDRLNILEPGSEIPVRVISVPKTLKTPRIIAIEPTAMQYAQQSLFRAFLCALKEDGFLSRVIGIRDQDPNREMAREGSRSGDLATLDLSEASDRVSNEHVVALMEDWPHLSAAVQATRSTKAHVPGIDGTIHLAKYASMGSALCFPVEELVFLTLIFLGIQDELSTPLTRRSVVKRFRRTVRVFGDDLIVPRDYVLSVVHNLELFGFKVNMGKSFWTGRFRESCGKEYYDGHDVSITRVRRVLPTRRLQAREVISASETRNLAYKAGLWQTARWLDDYLGKLLKVYPNVAPTSSLLGRISYLGYEFQRLDRKTHSPLTKGYFVSTNTPIDNLDGEGALLKCLLRTAPHVVPFAFRTDQDPEVSLDLQSADDEHLERAGRPEYVDIKLGWRSPF